MRGVTVFLIGIQRITAATAIKHQPITVNLQGVCLRESDPETKRPIVSPLKYKTMMEAAVYAVNPRLSTENVAPHAVQMISVPQEKMNISRFARVVRSYVSCPAL